MILELVESSDPLITSVAEDFDFQNPPIAPNVLARDMVETLYSTDGLGLACNQVGLPYRMFVMAGNPPITCFNPKIIDVSEEIVEMDEACLTYPGLSCTIKRPRHIKVRFQDFNGNIFTEKYTGMSARIFQHELDHLDGVRFFDNLTPLKRERALRQWKKLKRQFNRVKA